MKTIGRTSSRIRCAFCIVADMKYDDVSWLIDVDDEQQRAPPVDSSLGDVDEAEPLEARARVLREDLVLEVAQDEEERDEDRDLEDDRQARGGRVDLVLAVELHQLFVLLLPVVLLLLLDLLHLRRVRLEVLHRVDLPHRDRHEQEPHETTSATIDHAQAARPVAWNHSRRSVRRSSIGGAGSADDHAALRRDERQAVWSRLVDAAVAPRVAAQEPPAGEQRRRARGRARGRRRARTASSSGGTCRSRRGVSEPEACAARPGRRRSRAHLMRADLAEHLADCSTSQSWPRASAASASPGRATRT